MGSHTPIAYCPSPKLDIARDKIGGDRVVPLIQRIDDPGVALAVDEVLDLVAADRLIRSLLNLTSFSEKPGAIV